MAKSKSVLASLTTWKLFAALWSKGITRPEHTIFTANCSQWTWSILGICSIFQAIVIQLNLGRNLIILIYDIGAIGNEER